MTDKEEKYETNEIELKDIPTDWYLSTNPDCEWLTHNDSFEAFTEYVEDNLTDDNSVELFSNQPKVYVFKPESAFEISADDIFDLYYDNTRIDQSDYSYPTEEMEEALVKVNEVLAKMPKNYDCVGYIKPDDIKEDWEETLRNNGED